MANPQPEEGHIDIANSIADKFCTSRISGEEWQVLWVILRKTYGWHKKEDHIGLGQFSQMTGLTRQHALRALKKLELKHIVTVTKNGNTGANLYKFIKNFDTWLLLPKKDTVLPNLVGGVTKNGVEVLPKMVHTKETTQKKLSKENYTQEFLTFYTAYPLKVEKPFAFKTWQKLNSIRPDLEIILSAIQIQKEWRKNANGEFRPEWKNPATWLNKGCWDDECNEGLNNGRSTKTRPLEGNGIPEYKSELPIETPEAREHGKRVLAEIRQRIEKDQIKDG